MAPQPDDAFTERRPRGRLSPVHGAHARYSRFVGLMKVLLPSLALVLVAAVALWPRLMNEDKRFQVGFAQLSPGAVNTLAMVNARYHGVDENNRPFAITADTATETAAGSGLIELEMPKADFTTKSGAGVYIEARKGFYNQKAQTLRLEGQVDLFQGEGYELHTNSAEVDLVKSTAVGHEPVSGHGPQGMLEGEGFAIRDEGRTVQVTGKSKLVLHGAGGKKK